MSYNPLYTGSQAKGSSVALVTNYLNSTGLTIAQGSPVSAQLDGSIALTDVSNQQSVQSFVGYAQARIFNAMSGPIISGGRLTNLQGFSFLVGDAIYISTTGSLQNTKPVDANGNPVSPFVVSDFMIFCGVIVQNETNNTLQDLQIFTQDFGAL